MSMVKCKECGKKVSTEALSCPNCGAPPPSPPKTSVFASILTILFAVFFFFIVFNSVTESNKQKEEKAKQQRLAQIQVQKKARIQAEKIAMIRKKKIDYFLANKEQILSSLNSDFSKEKYQLVISESNKYLISKDKELTNINVEAKKQLRIIEKAKKTKKLLDDLTLISDVDYKKNKNIYESLVKLHPNNEDYKLKLTFYTEKFKLEKKLKKTNKILTELKSIPAREFKKNLDLYNELLVLHPSNKKYSDKKDYYFAKYQEKLEKLRIQSVQNSAKIDSAIASAKNCYSEVINNTMRTGVKSVDYVSCRQMTSAAKNGTMKFATSKQISEFMSTYQDVLRIVN